jgi:AcrR family transcriptional regulator
VLMMRANLRDERQELILATAQRLISESGPMAELAAETGLSRPAIYQYFASREHVLAELMINEMADLSNAIDAHISQFEDPLERIRIWVHYTLAHLASAEHRIIRAISIESLPEESRGMLKSLHGYFMAALTSPVAQLGAQDVTATCHLIYAAVAASASRIDAGNDFSREAAALEKFVVAGLEANLTDNHKPSSSF